MKHMYVFTWLTLLLGWATTTHAQTVYEAETAATNGDIFYSYPGATGGGIVGNLHPGRYVSFTVQVAQAGYYSAVLRYATGYTPDRNEKLAVEINGAFSQQAVFAPTGTWDGWRPHTVVVALRAGTNTITYRAGSPETGYINIDHLKVEPAQTVYEAETAATNGDLFYSYPGATGTQGGIVANLHAGRYVSFTVQVAQAGYHNLILRYSTGYTTNQQLALEINGEFDQRVVFAPTGAWDGWRPHTVAVALRAGTNTITYRAGSPETGYISMDHLNVESVVDAASSADQLGDNHYTSVIDSLTQYLDRSQITTGILYDRVMPLAALHTFNEGATDTSFLLSAV